MFQQYECIIYNIVSKLVPSYSKVFYGSDGNRFGFEICPISIALLKTFSDLQKMDHKLCLQRKTAFFFTKS